MKRKTAQSEKGGLNLQRVKATFTDLPRGAMPLPWSSAGLISQISHLLAAGPSFSLVVKLSTVPSPQKPPWQTVCWPRYYEQWGSSPSPVVVQEEGHDREEAYRHRLRSHDSVLINSREDKGI